MQPFIADHLDPCLAGDAATVTFRIDLSQQLSWEINVDALLGHMSIGEVGRDIFATLSALGNDVNIHGDVAFSELLAHRLAVPVEWYARLSPPTYSPQVYLLDMQQ